MKGVFMSVCFGAVLAITSCNSHENHKKEATHYLVTNPLVRDTMVTREYVCQIRSIQHIELRAMERGYLQEIFVDEGKFVNKGQLMFQILPLKYKAELQKAQAEADFAEVEYRTTKALTDSNVVSPNELALAKAKYDKARADVELAKVHLGFTQIRAPFTGLMDKFQVRLGSFLDEGDLLTTMSDISTLWVYFNVPEAEYLDYKKNSKANDYLNVKLRMANNKMYNHMGVVKTIEADFNNETGTIAFRATFPNPDLLLRHGETGNIEVTVPLKNAMIIPQKATFEVLDKKYVYVVNKNNEVNSRRIHIEAELPDLYVISDGLKADEKILLEGLRLVKENDKIDYKFQDPNMVISHLRLHAE